MYRGTDETGGTFGTLLGRKSPETPLKKQFLELKMMQKPLK
jgi:hypothetical protein